jgi:hypothetical protein
VGNSGALEIHFKHLLARVFGGFFHGLGNFIGLAVADPDAAAPIADHDQGAKAERTSTLDDFGTAVNADDSGLDAALFAAAVARFPTASALGTAA